MPKGWEQVGDTFSPVNREVAGGEEGGGEEGGGEKEQDFKIHLFTEWIFTLIFPCSLIILITEL
jgi:hypothetical protein